VRDLLENQLQVSAENVFRDRKVQIAGGKCT